MTFILLKTAYLLYNVLCLTEALPLILSYDLLGAHMITVWNNQTVMIGL